MKTVIKDGKYARVSNQEADRRVSLGWTFCPKSEWKKNSRDVGREESKSKS
jgi:hypothetical protein